MAGVIVGMELAEAMITARAYGAADDLALVEYLGALEAGALAGVAKQMPQR